MSNNSRLKILIVNGNSIESTGMESLIKTTYGDAEVLTRRTPDQAFAFLSHNDLSVLIWAIQDFSSLETLLHNKRSSNTGIRVIVINKFSLQHVTAYLYKIGVMAFLQSNVSKGEFLNCVTDVLNGKRFYQQSQSGDLIQFTLTRSKESVLTPIQQKVYNSMVMGFDDQKMFDKFNFAKNTLKNHKQKIFLKIGFKNQLALFRSLLTQL